MDKSTKTDDKKQNTKNRINTYIYTYITITYIICIKRIIERI